MNKPPEQMPKRQYKKKDPNRPRLCADDVMAKDKLIYYQDTYAEAMNKYGLQRGKRGSEARHISLGEFYRSQMVQSENLQTNIELLLAVEEAKQASIAELEQKEQDAKLRYEQAEEQKQQKESELKKTEESLSQAKGQLKSEELKNKAADIGSNIMDGIGSLVGTSKVKRKQQEIDNLKEENTRLQTEIKTLKEQIQSNEREHIKVTDKLRQELDKIYSLFPKIKELLLTSTLGHPKTFSKNFHRRAAQ